MIPIDGTNPDNFGTLAEAVAAYLAQFPKTCHCCHHEFEIGGEGGAFSTAWLDRPLKAVANGLEYRDCFCGSTLNVCVEIFFPSDRPKFGEPTHLNQIVGGRECSWCRGPSVYKYCSPRCTRDALGMTPAEEHDDPNEDESEAA